MRYSSGLETDLLILMKLALEKEYAQYDLPKFLGKTYRTVLRHIKILEDNDLIKVTRLEESEKGGKDRKIYGLRLLGLVELLKVPDAFNFIDQIVDNYSNLLPLILGKWHLFKKYKFEGLIIKRLGDTVKKERIIIEETTNGKALLKFFYLKYGKRVRVLKELLKELSEMKKYQQMIITGLEGIVEYRITRNVLLGFSPSEAKKQTEFLMLLKKDKELRVFVDSEFGTMEKNLQSWKELWKNI